MMKKFSVIVLALLAFGAVAAYDRKRAGKAFRWTAA